MPDDGRVLIARIGAPHGVRGEVRLIAFGDDPFALEDYGPLETRDGRTFEILGLKLVAEKLIARLAGVTDRTAAEALTNLDLFVARDRLPPPEDEDTFYHADLIGLAAVLPDGAPLGTVIAVPNFGAGDLVEIAPVRGPTLLVPFTRAVVPEIDLPGRRIVVDPPAGLLGGDKEAKGEDGEPDEAAAEPER
ncbi:ribosome maturation factor RimM [Segnochrobactrum spirostomi]|uniref:Ribosome maturation factor RimM n=1 Tax=Segnochrobactrum spirostomi TaxID=2608987 RepID=A0A6A7Y2T2_9HYPH|nr:ribosome maturation factor RimM [Segnochrobactrum spirostomi]MQT13015.1 ribosome maturation factor RimM [Segnochrobactrum spirostomi]